MKIVNKTRDSVTYELTYEEALTWCHLEDDVKYVRGMLQEHVYPPSGQGFVTVERSFGEHRELLSWLDKTYNNPIYEPEDIVDGWRWYWLFSKKVGPYMSGFWKNRTDWYRFQ